MDLSLPQAHTELAKYRLLSPKCGLRVSPLQLGAMSIGNAWADRMGSLEKEQAFELLDAFVAAGGNFIDTANNYQDEQSEKWLGEWMQARQNRDRLVIATKYTADYRSYEVGKNVQVTQGGNSKRSMFTSVRDSLAKLQTEWIDLLYVHWWEFGTSVEEVMDGLDILVKQGKVLYLGVSDAPAWVVAAANTYAAAHGKTPFVMYQGRWNVMLRDVEREILPMCRQFGMAVAPWDVLGGGRFKTAAQIAQRKDEGGKLRNVMGLAPPEPTADEQAYSAALEAVAQELGIASLTAVALAYVMAKAPYVFPIVGGRRIEHLHDNMQALSIQLSPEQIQRLESVRPFDLGFPGNLIGTEYGGSFMHKLYVDLAFVKTPKPIGYD